MYKKDLQIFLGRVTVESKLSKSSKLQLLKFIEKEASEEQLMILYLDGEIIKLDEQSNEIVRDRFKASLIEIAPLVMGVAATAAGAFALGASFGIALKAANAIRKRFLTQEGRVCSGLKKDQKRACKLKLKVASIKQQINIFNSKKTMCSKDKNPEKCKVQFNQKINSLESNLKDLMVS